MEYWKDRCESATAAAEAAGASTQVQPRAKAHAVPHWKGDSKGDGKQVTKAGHGGWAPKCARLVKAYFKKNWGRCDQLSKEYYESPIVKAIVDQNF